MGSTQSYSINEFTPTEKKTHDEAIKRLVQFDLSLVLPLPDVPHTVLSKGTILKSINSDTYHNSKGWNIEQHAYAIFECYEGSGRYTIIEKVDPKDGEYCIQKNTVTTAELKRTWNMLLLARYEDTFQMADLIWRNKLDAGFDALHLNSEHFVTFCLTRFIAKSHQSENFRSLKALSDLSDWAGGKKFDPSGNPFAFEVPSYMSKFKIDSRKQILIGDKSGQYHDPWCHHNQSPTVSHLCGREPRSHVHLSKRS